MSRYMLVLIFYSKNLVTGINFLIETSKTVPMDLYSRSEDNTKRDIR